MQDFIVVQGNSNKEHYFPINICQYDSVIMLYYSFGCNSTFFWYLQASNDECDDNVTYYLFDPNLYTVSNCPSSTVYSSTSAYSTTTTVNVTLTAVPQSGSSTVINSSLVCISNEVAIDFCWNHNNYKCFITNNNKKIECFLVQGNTTYCTNNAPTTLQCYNMTHIDNSTNSYIDCLYRVYHNEHKNVISNNAFIYCNKSTVIITTHVSSKKKSLFIEIGIPIIVVAILLCLVLVFCCCFYRCCRRNETPKEEPQPKPKYKKVNVNKNKPCQNNSVIV